MNTFTVDRIESGYFILETEEKTYIDVPKDQVSEDAKEGSVLRLSETGIYEVDAIKTAERKNKLFQMQNSLFGE